MPPRPIREFNTDKAKELAAIYSIQQDLERIIIWLGILIESLQTPSTEQENKGLESLWMASLIFYARCFKGGVRKKLDADIYTGLQGDPLALHEWLIDMRDKRVAHSVNAYEKYITGLLLDDELRVEGVFTGHIGYSFPGIENCKMIQELVGIAHKHTAEKIKSLKGEVKEEAEQLSPNELRRLKTVRFDAPGPEQAGQRR